MGKLKQHISLSADVIRLVGQQLPDVYYEFSGEALSNDIHPRLVLSSIDPEFKGRVMAEIQLIDQNGFPFFYSEPRSQLPEQWDIQPEDLNDTFVIIINQSQ